jgi:hypothetical protein
VAGLCGVLRLGTLKLVDVTADVSKCSMGANHCHVVCRVIDAAQVGKRKIYIRCTTHATLLEA